MTQPDRLTEALVWAEQGPHPGEPSIGAGKAPGGMVFQTWVGETLIHEDCLRDPRGAIGDAGARAGELALARARESDRIELRVFDGDTGAWVMTRTFPGRK